MDISELNGKTLLVVDDDKFNIQLIETMLEKIADVKVLSTDKGSEALTVLKTCSHYIDLIMLDLHMPEMEGDEVLRIIRNEMNLTVPVIIISVNGLDEKALIEKGADDFVLKPFDLEDLKEKILKHLQKGARS